MAIRVLTLVWDRYPGGGSKLLTMLALADWAGEDGGRIYPSFDTLADKIRMSKRQAIRIMQELETTGFIQSLTPENSGGRARVNRYRIKLETLKQHPRLDGRTVTKCHPLDENNGDKSEIKGDKLTVKGDMVSEDSATASRSAGEPLEPLYNRTTPPNPPQDKTPHHYRDGTNPETRIEGLKNYIRHIENIGTADPEELERARAELVELDPASQQTNLEV